MSAPYPAPRTAWTLTALLTAAYVFSFVDRYILGLLVEPIKADLGVSDEALGYLLGPAFGEGRYDEAAKIFADLVDNDTFVEFLTLPAYEKID